MRISDYELAKHAHNLPPAGSVGGTTVPDRQPPGRLFIFKRRHLSWIFLLFLVVADAVPEIVVSPLRTLLQALDLIEDPDAFQPIDLTALPNDPPELRLAAEAYNRHDYVYARQLFKDAAQIDSALAYYYLGVTSFRGRGVSIDYSKAREYYELAAHFGEPKSIYNLGVMLRYGEGGNRDVKRAISLYKTAASLNNQLAQFALGRLYINGIDIPRDKKRGIRMIMNTAEAGHCPSINYLTSLYWMKNEHTSRDVVKANFYLNQLSIHDCYSALPYFIRIVGYDGDSFFNYY